MQINPGPTEDNHGDTSREESPLTMSQQIDTWRTNIGGPIGHKGTVKDDTEMDDSLCEGSKLTPLHELIQKIENDDDESHELRNKRYQWKDIVDVRSPKNDETALHMTARKGFIKTASQFLAA
jgi:hypothetical protein